MTDESSELILKQDRGEYHQFCRKSASLNEVNCSLNIQKAALAGKRESEGVGGRITYYNGMVWGRGWCESATLGLFCMGNDQLYASLLPSLHMRFSFFFFIIISST